MTIHITSTTDSKENVSAAMGQPKPEGTDGGKSAPEAKAPEHKESTESGTEEAEAKEDHVQDPPGEADPEDGPDNPEDPAKDGKAKKKGGFQRRIDKLNAAKAAAQQETEYWKQLALKGAGEAKTEPKKVEPTPSDSGKPNPDKFDTHAEYVEALTDWKTDQKLKERDQKLEQSRLMTEQQTLQSSHASRINAFVEKTPDFRETLESLDTVPYSAAVQELVVSSENGPEILYELAKDPKEAARICTLPPLAAAREIGKIESRIESAASDGKKSETKKTTNAPKPIAPVGGKGSATEKSIGDPNLTQKEYEALRAKQRAG